MDKSRFRFVGCLEVQSCLVGSRVLRHSAKQDWLKWIKLACFVKQ
jgi:hypothetical protein